MSVQDCTTKFDDLTLRY